MSTSQPLTRRRFLLLGAVVGAGLGLLRLPIRPRLTEPAKQRLARLFAHLDSARAVGQEYLSAVPSEADAGILVDLVTRGMPNRSFMLRAAGEEELRALFALRVSEDFEKQRTVEVSGWILSRTEARLCALAAAGAESEGSSLRSTSWPVGALRRSVRSFARQEDPNRLEHDVEIERQ